MLLRDRMIVMNIDIGYNKYNKERVILMKELQMPLIYKDNDMIGYGGDQEWFLDSWARRAGCASVLASNMYAYYLHQSSYELSSFLKVMESMFHQMTPGYMGYPYLYKFARTFVKIMKEEDIDLKPVYQKKSKNYKHAMMFVKESIDDGHPISMLILHHHAKELEDDNWHWVCLSGYIPTEKGYDIIFSDCGQRRVIDSHILFDTSHKNVFKMVRMKNDPTK